MGATVARFVLALSGDDRKGIVAAVANSIGTGRDIATTILARAAKL